MIKCPGCGEENQPRFRFCPACGTPLANAAAAPQPPREVRKTVTVVFSDLKGSTALGEQIDSEALHEIKEHYFTAMAAEITRHGGKIEKYIGDAIMAVFGLPRAHEDDALRAVRAAAGMQAALVNVNQGLMTRHGVALSNRTGINAGEEVANDDPNANQKLATGDAVNIAARLEQAAPENQIYIGEVTFQLVRDAVKVEPVEPLELKGKAERVCAYRLVSVSRIEGNARRIDTPIVGRDAELATLAAAYLEVCEVRSARLVTVIGDAGVGKVGRGSENKVPFVAAVQTTEAGQAVLVCLAQLPFIKTALAQFCDRSLARPLTVVSDGLACFVAAEGAGVHERVITGGGKASVTLKQFKAVNTTIGNLKTAMSGTYHAIKFAKYVHRYLAEFQYRFNRRFDLSIILKRLAWVAVRTKSTTRVAIRAAEVGC